MGRPKVHDEHTAFTLLNAAERLVAEDGLEALSIRRDFLGADATRTRESQDFLDGLQKAR